MTRDIIETIDNALREHSLSSDAMRWTPDAETAETPAPISNEAADAVFAALNAALYIDNDGNVRLGSEVTGEIGDGVITLRSNPFGGSMTLMTGAYISGPGWGGYLFPHVKALLEGSTSERLPLLVAP